MLNIKLGGALGSNSGQSDIGSSGLNRDEPRSDKSTSIDWIPMDSEFELTQEDEDKGLGELLYGARDFAADAVFGLLSELGVDGKQFEYINNMPVGLEEGSDVAGEYLPGMYGIIVGRETELLGDFLAGNEDERAKVQRKLAGTMAHEMIHAIQTVPSNRLEGGYVTIGSEVMGWAGLEEGMAEAFGNIAIDMSLNNSSMKESAERLEKFCEEYEVPATQMSARLIRKMDPAWLRWYLTCGKATGGVMRDNKARQAFGDSYGTFCRNMVRLSDHEVYGDLSDATVRVLVDQTSWMIDRASGDTIGEAASGEVAAS